MFTQYRDTLEMIHQKLEKEGIKSAKFFGQASKDGEKGLTQKEQKAIIKSFRMGEYDVLISTSVAEELFHFRMRLYQLSVFYKLR